ncbi:hypothetical protein [Pseudomonas migulae]|uniref:Uncharacterized protein n=1 Tax=Pseudomonas migulae TaxID=78543 RepID=A0A1H5L785_9PSED|nr:hypothetical protein [Pseudomonas migulae]SEE72965.1 hypothetical protein SAMN04490194_3765 [Pseudomonas migulae]
MIEVKNVSYGNASSSQILYFTGGLAVFQLPDGEYALGPVPTANALPFYKFKTLEELTNVAKLAGALRVGTNETIQMQSTEIAFWRPDNTSPKNGLNSAADRWSGISYSAHLKNDESYQIIGRYISVSMQAAGIRLRDIALLHHDQLIMALEQPSRVGMGFSNIQMLDLYLAFHSLATELCSARDYLARLAAMHIRAKDSVDNMPRLEDWLKKAAHKDQIKEPLAQLMMNAWGSNESPGFLRTLGDLRNKMVHRQPMSANPESAMLKTKETATDFGPILTIRLAPKQSEESGINATPDPFEAILQLSQQMEKLSTQAADLAKYEPEIISFLAR